MEGQQGTKGSAQLPLGPEGEGKRKYSLFIAFVFLITNAYSGKCAKFHKSMKKKLDSLKYWQPGQPWLMR